MPSDPSNEKELDLLMQKYLALRSEVLEFVKHYRAHAKYLGVILTLIVALLSFAGKTDGGFVLFKSRMFWFFAGISITTIVTYFVFDALEAQYAMFASASRVAVLEKMINERAGKSLLVWESKLSDKYWWEKKPGYRFWWSANSPLRGVRYPSKFLIVYMICVVFLALLSVPLYSAYALAFNPAYKDYVGPGRILIAINIGYAAISFWLIARVAPTVLWRMKGPARNLAHEVTKGAQEEFEEEHRPNGN